MSTVDSPLLLIALPPMTLRFFAGEKWKTHWFLGPILRGAGAVYINRGQVDRRALREALDALEEGGIFALAPEGRRSRQGKMMAGHDGAAYLASRGAVPVLPIGLVNSDRFVANLRRGRRTHFSVHIGEPFDLPLASRRPRGPELAAGTHLIMIRLAALLPERYHGVFRDDPALIAFLRGEDPWPYCLAAAGLGPADGLTADERPSSPGEREPGS